MTVIWRRAILEETDLLDPNLPLTFDYDLWLRLAKRGAPFYIPERVANFRWYETSKSGANFIAQFAEDFAVARKHGLSGGWPSWRKRMKTAQILAIYRLMRWGRAFGLGRAN
jgi:hypothetical protein